MYIVSGKQMEKIDQIAIRDWGIPQEVLMENAGLRVLDNVEKELGSLQDKIVLIVVGRGNNGGDGLVVARHLVQRGCDVRIFILGDKEFTGAALVNYNIAKKLPLKIYEIKDDKGLHLLKLTMHYTDLVVDAVFGTGLSGEIRGLAKETIEIINESKAYVVAVDIPSGVDADTGLVSTTSVKADLTVCFGLPKLGIFLSPGKEFAGKTVIADIGIPQGVYEQVRPDFFLTDRDFVGKNLPCRFEESHKYNYGHLLLIGGSLGMMGAVNLAARGGFALGAGLVTAAVPRSIQAQLAATIPELITRAITENSDEGTISFQAKNELLELLKGKSAIVFGPGLRDYSDNRILEFLVSEAESPLVIDADGLNMLAKDLNILYKAKVPIIITPHPGEMARLLKATSTEVQEDRISSARLISEEYGIWVVLKGNRTLISDPQGKIYFNPTGGPALATAGTGDVLAGMIGAMLGQNENIEAALTTAVYLHGLAGDYVAKSIGEISSTAGDVVSAVVKVIKEFK